MKKTLCILAIICLLFVATSQADSKADSVSLFLSARSGEICLRTSAVPEQDFRFSVPEGLAAEDFLSLFRPDLPGLISDCFFETVRKWNLDHTAPLLKGMFAGDLFDAAAVKQQTEIGKEDFALFFSCLSSTVRDSGIDGKTVLSLEHFFQSLAGQTAALDLSMTISAFDSGKYFTVNVYCDQQPVIVLSADLSGNVVSRWAVTRRAGDVVYYETITCKRNNFGFAYEFHLFRSNSQSLRAVRETDLVQTAELHFTDPDQTFSYTFEGTIVSTIWPSEMKFIGSGTVGTGESSGIEAELSFGDNNEDIAGQLIPAILSVLFP